MGVKVQIDNPDSTNRPEVKILCLDLDNFSPTVQFLLCSCAVFFFFILYGYLQVIKFLDLN